MESPSCLANFCENSGPRRRCVNAASAYISARSKILNRAWPSTAGRCPRCLQTRCIPFEMPVTYSASEAENVFSLKQGFGMAPLNSMQYVANATIRSKRYDLFSTANHSRYETEVGEALQRVADALDAIEKGINDIIEFRRA